MLPDVSAIRPRMSLFTFEIGLINKPIAAYRRYCKSIVKVYFEHKHLVYFLNNSHPFQQIHKETAYLSVHRFLFLHYFIYFYAMRCYNSLYLFVCTDNVCLIPNLMKCIRLIFIQILIQLFICNCYSIYRIT